MKIFAQAPIYKASLFFLSLHLSLMGNDWVRLSKLKAGKWWVTERWTNQTRNRNTWVRERAGQSQHNDTIQTHWLECMVTLTVSCSRWLYVTYNEQLNYHQVTFVYHWLNGGASFVRPWCLTCRNFKPTKTVERWMLWVISFWGQGDLASSVQDPTRKLWNLVQSLVDYHKVFLFLHILPVLFKV